GVTAWAPHPTLPPHDLLYSL
ncbi:hypothetical protein A2U01_0074373, partial [Trifolium medium]|nr:hypothetical protein [Trifolium medium]